MNVFVNRNCPICDNVKGRKSIKPDLHPKDNIEKIKDYWRGFYKKRFFFPYSRCECGFLYCDEYFSPNYLNKLYSSMGDNVHSGDSVTDDMTKDMYIEKIGEILARKDNVSVLELGADNGTLIKKLKKFKNISHVTAIEPNKEMHERLSKVSSRVCSDLSELSESETFDLVICIHVLDHIPEISEYLEELGKRIKKDGLIFGIVHDESSILAKLLADRWPAYCLQHPHLFNPVTIKQILDKNDLSQIEIYKTTNSFKFGYLLYQLFLAVFKIKISFPDLFNINLKVGNIGFIFKKIL